MRLQREMAVGGSLGGSLAIHIGVSLMRPLHATRPTSIIPPRQVVFALGFDRIVFDIVPSALSIASPVITVTSAIYFVVPPSVRPYQLSELTLCLHG
ncbi:hypothetical protein V8E53_007076 [Lactarius tabidus]